MLKQRLALGFMVAKILKDYSGSFFEPETNIDNKTGKTHSPHRTDMMETNAKDVRMYDLGDKGSSCQNTYLSKVIKDTFQFRLDLDYVAPFKSAVVYLCPLESIVLTLECYKFQEWLRRTVPGVTLPPSGSVPRKSDDLQ